MSTVAEELENIDSSSGLTYLDDAGDFLYIVKISKEEAVLQISIPENYPVDLPIFDLVAEVNHKDYDENMKRAVLKVIQERCRRKDQTQLIAAVSQEWKDIWEESRGNIKNSVQSSPKRQQKSRKKLSPRKIKLAAKFQMEPPDSKSSTPDSYVLNVEKMKASNQCHMEEKCEPSKESTTSVYDLKTSEKWIRPDALPRILHKDEVEKKPGKKGKDRTVSKSNHGGKKSSMKTAKDVIDRIKWDRKLNHEDFILGYTDRFVGIKEVKIFDLNWDDDISSTGPADKLAIPEHRIEYFKWKSEKVWEKKTRKDLIFGSTGSGVTIHEFIARAYRENSQENNGGLETIMNAHNCPEIQPEQEIPIFFKECKVSDDEIQYEVSSVMNHILMELESDQMVPCSIHDDSVITELLNEMMELVVDENKEMVTLPINSPVVVKLTPRQVPSHHKSAKFYHHESSSSSASSSRGSANRHHSRDQNSRKPYDRPKREKPSSKWKKQDISDHYKPPNYCITADLNDHIVHKIQHYQQTVLKSWFNDLSVMEKPYLNVFTCRLDTEEDCNRMIKLMHDVTNRWHSFNVELAEVSTYERNIWAGLENDYSLHQLFKRFQRKDLRHYHFDYSPHVIIAEVPEDITPFLERIFFGHLRISGIRLCEITNESEGQFFPFLDHQTQNYSKGRKRHRDDTSSINHQSHFKQQRQFKNINWETQVSKKLSAILRHNAMGFEVDNEGYIAVDVMLGHQYFRRMEVTEEDIFRIVNNNVKQRFTLTNEQERLWIRANQGHTVEVGNLHLKEITDPTPYPCVVHGTFHRFWHLIKQTGLKKMKRNHIHMTTSEPTPKCKVVSGMRNSCNVFVYVDIAKALEDGIKFFESDNGVILSDGIEGVLEPKYFQNVVGICNNERRNLLQSSEKDEG